MQAADLRDSIGEDAACLQLREDSTPERIRESDLQQVDCACCSNVGRVAAHSASGGKGLDGLKRVERLTRAAPAASAGAGCQSMNCCVAATIASLACNHIGHSGDGAPPGEVTITAAAIGLGARRRSKPAAHARGALGCVTWGVFPCSRRKTLAEPLAESRRGGAFLIR